MIAKSEVTAPQRAAFLHQVHVVGPGLAPAKELSARHASLAAVLVSGSYEGSDAILRRYVARPARRYVENRLGAHTRDRGAADVFESQRQRATRVVNALPLGSEERGPAGVVLDETDDAGFETQTVSLP